jgi:hypothetical protein
MLSRRLTRLCLVPVALAVLVPALSALAQTAEKKDALTPPTATVTRASEGSLITMALVIILGMLVVAVSFFPSKRGHND